MKTRALALGGLASILGLATAFGVSAQTFPGKTGAGPQGGRMGREGRERHPELVAALRALRNARERLHKADRDFGGHRAKAEEHTEAAIREVELALAYDKH